MKVGTAAKVFLGKNELVKEFSGIQIGTDVILGKAEGRTKDLSGLVLSNYLMLGKGISRAVIATVYGVPPLSLPDAIDSSLYSLKAFGGTESVAETYIDEVTADGKCEQRNLPDGYTQLEYIESSGTQYINTDVSGNATIKITAQASAIKGSSQALLSSTNGAFGGTWFGEFTTNQKWGIGTGDGLSTIDPTTKITAELAFDGSGCSGTINGESVTRTVTITQGTWTIMATDGLSYPFSGKVWGCQITQGGTLVRNFVPCKNSSNVVGMYDTVSGTFFENDGTGDFVAGNAVSPTPTTPIDIVCNNGVLKLSPNLFDPTKAGLTSGKTINNSGAVNDRSDRSATVNGTRVKSNTSYTISYTGTARNGVFFYDTNDSFLSYISWEEQPRTFTTPADCVFVRVSFDSATLVTNLQLEQGSTATTYRPYGVYADGTTETITDALSNTATCERLLSVGDYKDTQAVVAGTVTRNVGIMVLDGTEDWRNAAAVGRVLLSFPTQIYTKTNIKPICTHFKGQNGVNGSSSVTIINNMAFYNGNTNDWEMYIYYNDTAANFKTFLAAQYAAGTPVIVLYPLSTATTETVTGQFLSKTPVTYTGSVDGLTGTVTETSHTVPTPTQPLDVNTNNGVLKYGQYGKNLFDKTTITANRYVNSSGVVTSDGTNKTVVSDKIYVKPSTQYTLSGMGDVYGASYGRTGYQYKADNTPITAIARTSGEAITFTTDSECAYVIVMSTNEGVDTTMLEQGSTATTYEPYHFGLHTDGTVETINIHTKNLFDEQWNRNTGVSTQTATWGQVVYANGWSTSGLIPVKAGQQYTVSYNTTVAIYVFYYESDGTMQQSYDYATSNTKKTFTVPNGATNVRIQVNKSTEEAIAELESQLEVGSTNTAYVPYFNGGTATCEDLLSVGTSTDEQEVIAGNVTRKVGVKVLDGTESWTIDGVSATYGTNFKIEIADAKLWTLNSTEAMCNKFNAVSDSVGKANIPTWCFRGSSASKAYWFRSNLHTTTTEWQQWLSAQYNAGTPVIVVYPLATETTETVTGQPMSTTEGDNIAEITQASMDGLELEVMYYKKP